MDNPNGPMLLITAVIPRSSIRRCFMRIPCRTPWMRVLLEDYSDENDSAYQGGPTVLDRRGSGERSWLPPASDSNSSYSSARPHPPPADPEPAGDPTLLVFRDGHQLEVGNYAIVGSTLFDLTPGHSRKVPLSDLDLEATRKQNYYRGVVFQLPASLQAN